MRRFSDSIKIQRYISSLKKQGKVVGFVPTMGALHEGHLSLLRKARQQSDVVVLSIFVNPKQFAPNEDLEKYPRNLEHDIELAEHEGTDIVFCPSGATIYPEGYSTYVTEDYLTRYWCGASRPDHFRGVTTIVLKLFNIVLPDTAFFGQKDIQQALVIRKMVTDLNLPVNICICPIVREPDGLALSSRNVYLNAQERKDALVLRKSLEFAQQAFSQGERRSDVIQAGMRKIILSAKSASIDYIGCADKTTLAPKDILDHGDIVLLAVYIGSTRLIDNCVLS